MATWLLGLLVFFDDYANSVLLGNTLQPLFRRLRISREKLAYLVDSTAAPVAGLALISTWVAGEIDFVQSGLDAVQLTGEPAFQLFVASLPYRFYPLWTLVFVFLVVWTCRDFGPMYRDEILAQAVPDPSPARVPVDARAASLTGAGPASGDMASHSVQLVAATEPDGRQLTTGWWNAVIPIFVTVAAVLILLYETGSAAASTAEQPTPSWMDIFGSADSYFSLLWGAFAGFVAALVLTVGQRLLAWCDIEEAMTVGAKQMLPAIGVLSLASALSAITGSEAIETRTPANALPPFAARDYRLSTGDYLTTLIAGQASSTDQAAAPPVAMLNLRPWLPSIIFVLAAAISFCTGTSWGTMAIVMPIAIQLVIGARHGSPPTSWAQDPILIGTIASVLAGSIFGDHCSPISDTTILSSQACGCDHMSHVRTQLPYALWVGVHSVVFGTLPIGFGCPIWIVLPLGTASLLIPMLLFGQRIEDSGSSSGDSTSARYDGGSSFQ